MATARRVDGRRATSRRRAQGQVLVIFAMALVGIMAAAGLAFDIGRFYSEKRFLQNAADAGALAVANALIRGETTTDAEAEGRDVLARNLLSSPTGTVAVGRAHAAVRDRPPPATRLPVSGILIVRRRRPRRDQERRRLHVRPGRRAELDGRRRQGAGRDEGRPAADRGPPLHQRSRSVRGRGRAMRREHQPLPGPRRDGEHVVSRQHDRRVAPLDPEPGHRRSTRTTPDDDPVNHGPIIALVGQGASPSNAASFRGFVALDIRNFQYAVAALERVLQRRHCRDEREHAQGHGGRLGRRPATRARTSRRVTVPPDPNDQVGDHRRQLVGHRRRRDQRRGTTPAPRSSRRSIRAPSRASRTSATPCRARPRSTPTRTATTRSP